MNPVDKLKDWTGSTKTFYGEVRGEMKKVTWPPRQEVVGTTVVVVAAVFFFGIYLGIVDQLLNRGVNWLFTYFLGPGG